MLCAINYVDGVETWTPNEVARSSIQKLPCNVNLILETHWRRGRCCGLSVLLYGVEGRT